MKKSARDSDTSGNRDLLFLVRKQIVRPDPKLVVRLSKLPTANLSDASGNLDTMDSGIHAMSPGARICGPACTVSTRAGDFVAT